MLPFLLLLVTHAVFALDCENENVGHPSPTDVTSEPICDGGTLNIKCPSGTLIHIVDVEWGRQDNVSCNYTSTDSTNCQSNNATDTVGDLCDNECTCSVSVNSQTLGDPCKGTHKYMIATWECVEIQECYRCEVFDVTADSCEAVCPPYTNNGNCTSTPGCRCKEGHVRDTISGKCVAQDRCPYYNSQNPNCTTDEVLDMCGPACERTCQDPEPECEDEKSCVPGYQCRRPLYRDTQTGMCIYKEDCPCICDFPDSSSSSSSESSSSEHDCSSESS